MYTNFLGLTLFVFKEYMEDIMSVFLVKHCHILPHCHKWCPRDERNSWRMDVAMDGKLAMGRVWQWMAMDGAQLKS